MIWKEIKQWILDEVVEWKGKYWMKELNPKEVDNGTWKEIYQRKNVNEAEWSERNGRTMERTKKGRKITKETNTNSNYLRGIHVRKTFRYSFAVFHDTSTERLQHREELFGWNPSIVKTSRKHANVYMQTMTVKRWIYTKRFEATELCKCGKRIQDKTKENERKHAKNETELDNILSG